MLSSPQFRKLSVLGVALVLSIAIAYVVAIWVHRDSTTYAPGYSWSKFSSIRNGMTPDEVTRILGQPLSIEQFGGEIHWDYYSASDVPGPVVVSGPSSFSALVKANFVADLSGKVIGAHHAEESPATEEMVGKSLDDVRKRFGSPPTVYTIPRQTMYWYSKLRNVKGEYVMLVHFDDASKIYQINADRIGHYCAAPGDLPRPSSFLEWLEWYVF